VVEHATPDRNKGLDPAYVRKREQILPQWPVVAIKNLEHDIGPA
jgi:hypothetical protein